MKHKSNNNLGYWILYGACYLLALLPWFVLYLISDLLFGVIYYLVGYRREIVRINLKNSFPEKNEKDIVRIEKEFYHFLCDYFVETIKLLHISDEEVKRRMIFENPELINELTKDGNSCLLSLGHYGNWEYVSSIGFYLSPQIVQGQIYKKLKSEAFEKFFLKIRSRFSPQCIEMKSAVRTIIRNKRQGAAMAIGFLSDQRPSRNLDQYWTRFLNQETLVLTGMERIARQFGFAIVYLDIKRISRGHYSGRFSLITIDASQEEEFAITEKYMRLLESTIRRDPPYWLWSHNRWKFEKKTENKS